MSTLQIIGHDFCQVLIKLPDQDSKLVDIIVPLEDLYVTNNQRLEIFYRSKFIFISFFFLERQMVMKDNVVHPQFLHLHHHLVVVHYPPLMVVVFIKKPSKCLLNLSLVLNVLLNCSLIKQIMFSHICIVCPLHVKRK